jgi:hypothetical protein
LLPSVWLLSFKPTPCLQPVARLATFLSSQIQQREANIIMEFE